MMIDERPMETQPKPFRRAWAVVGVLLLISWSLFCYDFGLRSRKIAKNTNIQPPPAEIIAKPFDDEEFVEILNFQFRKKNAPYGENWSLIMRSTGANFDYCVTRVHKDMKAPDGDGLMMTESACENTIHGAVDAIDNDWNVKRKPAPKIAPMRWGKLYWFYEYAVDKPNLDDSAAKYCGRYGDNGTTADFKEEPCPL